jgi:glycosyltransferase involved in cell wall biosynthesis
VDVDRFRFRQRLRCRRFVFVAGAEGTRAVRPGGAGEVRRKGLDVLIAAARLAPEIALIVYASREDVASPPPNVELRPPPEDNTLLYLDGDVCVQPSLWEGLGLPLLECQAAGMPLITTDAPPMSEHCPMALIPADREAVLLPKHYRIPAALVRPDDLAATLRTVHGRRIAAQSTRARRFIEREHNWRHAGPVILEALSRLVTSAGGGRPAALPR